MNGVLTELKLLTPEIRESVAMIDTDNKGFSGMLQQQFPGLAGDESQAIEFEEFFANFPIQADTRGATLDQPRVAGEQSLSARQLPVMLPVPDGVAQPTASPSPTTSNPVIESGPLAEALNGKGEGLPPGGNQLPPAESSSAAAAQLIESTVKSQTAPFASAPAAAAIDVAGEHNSTGREQSMASLPEQPGRAPVELQVAVLNRTPGTAPDSVSSITLRESSVEAQQHVPVLRTEPAKISTPLPEESPVTVDNRQAREAGYSARPETDLKLPAERTQTVQQTVLQSPVAPLRPIAESVSAEPRPVVLVGASAMTSAETNLVEGREIRQVSINDNLPGRETVIDKPLQHKSPVTGNELVQTEALAMREIAGKADTRSIDLSVPVPASTTQQPASQLNAGTAAAVAGIGNVVPATQPNPLPTPLEPLSLARNADAAEWSNNLGERVNWMINQKLNSASIRLDPPALGKLDVQIKVMDDATMINIQTQTLQTRDLIESVSARLRDVLQESGYQNVNVDVSQRQDQQQARNQATFDADTEQDDAGEQEQTADHQQQQQSEFFSGEGLVDTFA